MVAAPLNDGHAIHLARLLIAEDHRAMLQPITSTLLPECIVVGAVANGHDLLAAVEMLDPEIVVLDIGMPGMNGIEAARELQRSHPGIKLVFLTIHEEADYARAAFEAGGLGYVAKSRLASDLLPAVRAALAGQRFLSPSVHLDDAS